MAPGRGHVDVSERRLRPIYDCLDNGNNKKAIQEADKVLRKQKDFTCAKALKALALLRLGRHDESIVYLTEVHALHPTDEATLQAMSISYRELNKLDQIAALYDNAHVAKPDSEDILSALFMAYVRINEYKKQQQTAMKLHKLKTTKNPYYFWAVMSLVMQAHTDKKLAAVMFLPLAEKMVGKYVDDGKIEAEAEVQLYLIILQLRGKFNEALDVLQGKLGDIVTSDIFFKDQLEAELYVKLEQWPQVNATYRKLLKKHPDQWDYYVQYFTSFFKLLESQWQPSEEGQGEERQIDHTVDMVATFLQNQVELVSAAERGVRGPILAPLEFIKQMRAHNVEGEDKLGQVVDLVRLYCVKFSNKPCCFIDIKPYVHLLEKETMDKVLADLLSYGGWVDNSEKKLAKDTKDLQSHLCLLQLQRYLGHHSQLDKTSKLKLVEDLVLRYKDGLKFGENLVSSDLQFSDCYLQLAAHTLHDLFLEEKDVDMIMRAIVLLEEGLKHSPVNFQFKWLLLKFYCLIGAYSPCIRLYESMEIKHVQHDAISYILTNQVTRLGHMTSALCFFEQICRFFTYNYKDSSEYLVSAYKYGAFPKINELVEFRERLQQSLQYASATVERMLLELLIEPTDHQTVERVVTYFEVNPEEDVSRNLRDNRDTGVMVCWDKNEFTDEKKQQSFDEEMTWLHIRQHMLRALSVAVELGQHSSKSPKSPPAEGASSNGNSVSASASSLLNLISKLGTALIEAQGVHGDDGGAGPDYAVLTGPARTRLPQYLKLGLGTVLLEALETVLYVQCVAQQNDHNDVKKAADTSAKEETLKSGICSKVKGIVASCRQSLTEATPSYPETLAKIVMLAECVGQLTVLAGVCHRLVSPLKAAASKKAKRKKAASPEAPLPPVIISVQSLVAGLETCCEEIKSALNDLEPPTASLDQQLSKLTLADDNNTYQISEESLKGLADSLSSSYKDSSNEMNTFLTNKLTYLKSLKL